MKNAMDLLDTKAPLRSREPGFGETPEDWRKTWGVAWKQPKVKSAYTLRKSR